MVTSIIISLFSINKFKNVYYASTLFRKVPANACGIPECNVLRICLE